MTCKKALSRKWLKKDTTINEWINLVYNIYTMQRMTFKLRTQIDIFDENWLNGLSMLTIRPDFL